MAKDLTTRLKKAINYDGWINVLTGIGVRGRDKTMAAEIQWDRGVRQDFDDLYAADDIASYIADIVPEESMTKGYKLTSIKDQKEHDEIMSRLSQLKFNEKVVEAWKLSRIHGGCGIIKITEDAKLDQPIPMNKKILALNVVDRWDLTISSMNINHEITSPDYGNPLLYTLQIEGSNRTFSQTIHSSRVTRFDGVYLPKQKRQQNGYWGDSVFTKIRNAIRNYHISHDAAAATIQDFDIPVMKLKGLADLMGANCDDQVIERLHLVNMTKSVAKMIILDSDNEEFEHKSRNVTGMADLLSKVEDRLVTAAKMPRTKLFGESAGGLGSTGESQSTTWYDLIESQQTNFAKPKMLDIIRHILITEFGYSVDEAAKVDIEFSPLWQMSESEQATLRKTVAETDSIYIDKGVVDPVEVAISRFGGDKYSTDTIIDQSLRKELVESE